MKFQVPEWLIGLLVGSSGGGLLGYWLRARTDDHFAARKEARQFKQADLKAMREELLAFLGEPRAHFSWLENTPDVNITGGSPSAHTRAQIISDWVLKNASRYPKERRAPMYLIGNVAFQLAAGDRHFLSANPNGYEALHDAWEALDDYGQQLTKLLHGADS